MLIIQNQISLKDLKEMAQKSSTGLVKAVVDIEKKAMAIDADLHADEELALLEEGSQQQHLWGINLYPEEWKKATWIEFDSMINLRPSWGNKTRGVDDPQIREKITAVVNTLVSP